MGGGGRICEAAFEKTLHQRREQLQPGLQRAQAATQDLFLFQWTIAVAFSV
jgi:hypothetical protein